MSCLAGEVLRVVLPVLNGLGEKVLRKGGVHEFLYFGDLLSRLVEVQEENVLIRIRSNWRNAHTRGIAHELAMFWIIHNPVNSNLEIRHIINEVNHLYFTSDE